MCDKRKSLMPNANERYMAKTKKQEQARRVELEGISELEAKEKAAIKAKAAAGEENDSRASGVSLQMGSAEYREMIYDHQGRNEFEQMAAEMERLGKREANDFKKDDKWHSERGKKLEAERPAAERIRTDAGRKVLNTRMSRRARKLSYFDEMLAEAGVEAAGTASKDDDDYVKRSLPHILDEEVYDDANAEEDFYPGHHTLEKYI